MKRILTSILIIGVVSLLLGGGTFAYFSGETSSSGNVIASPFLEINWDGSTSQWGNSMYFPVSLAPGEDTSWIDPNLTPHDQRMKIIIASGSMIPDHFEVKFSTSNFRDGLVDGHGSASNKNQYTKMIEVTSLYWHTDGWSYHGLLSQIDDSHDGNLGFKSLYDLERTVIDDIPVGSNLNSLGFVLKLDESAGNKFQGDQFELEVTVAAAQAAGQDVL